MYEEEGDQLCVQAVYGINPVKSDFAVSCFYFENTDETSVQLETCII